MAWPHGRARDGGLDALPLPQTVGTMWLCGKRVVGPDPLAALGRAEGASTIVSFNERRELQRDYPDYVTWLDTNLDGQALWWPVPDLGAPALADAMVMVDAMIQRLDDGEGLILHCAGGIGRAPTMAACVLISLGMSSPEALEHVATHRPMAGPEAGAQRLLVDQVEIAVRARG